MTSSPVDSGPLRDEAPPLAAKLECAILSVLVHHHAEVESTLPTWYLSLKLAFPEVKDRTQVKNFFKHLWTAGLIALKSPWIGDYTVDSGDSDLDFLALGHFTVALTTLGVVRWDCIRRYRTHTETGTFSARVAADKRLRADTLPNSKAGSVSRRDASVSKLPSSKSCPERQALSNRVSDAGLDVELSKAALDAAKARGIKNLIGLQLAIAHARSVGRDAVQALDEHLKTHGCIVGGKVNRATAVGSVHHGGAAAS
jgi:hypothetical protein